MKDKDKNYIPSISDSALFNRYPELFHEFNIKLARNFSGEGYAGEVVSTKKAFVAYVVLREMGENFFVAKKGAPIEPGSIVHAKDGWRWIGDVVPDFFDAVVQTLSQSYDGNTIAPEIKIALYAAKLREFLLMSETDW